MLYLRLMSFCNKSLETDLNEEAKRANTRTVWMNTDSSQASILTDISFISSRDGSWTFFAFLIDWLTQNFNWFGAIIQYNTRANQASLRYLFEQIFNFIMREMSFEFIWKCVVLLKKTPQTCPINYLTLF